MHHFSFRSGVMYVALLAGFLAVELRADEPVNFERVAPLFQKHCYSCHSAEKPKGKLRIDQLDSKFVQGSDDEHWREVRQRLEFGDMPPETEPAVKFEDRELMVAWIAQGLRQSGSAKKQVTTFRRLTRREYEQTMQELLGLRIEFGKKLPEDGKSKDGFRNDGDVLRMSPLQYETYLQIADEALLEAIVTGTPPTVHRYRIYADAFRVEALPKPGNRPGESFNYAGQPFNIVNDSSRAVGGVLFPSLVEHFREAGQRLPQSSLAFLLFQAFRTGETVIRVRAARVKPEAGADARLPILSVALGSTNFNGVELRTVGEPVILDQTDPQTFEFRIRMENVSHPNTGPMSNRNSTVLAVWNSSIKFADDPLPPKLKVEWVEFENPYFETWPPKTHTDILFANEGLDEKAYVREVLRRFTTRAYRGMFDPVELDRLVNQWIQARKNTDSLEASLRETLSVILCAPRFLGLPASRSSREHETLTDHELASRLSYFLWSTMPDETLLKLADLGTLREPEVLSAQVQRMIQDSKSWSFIEQFTEQWLDLERLQKVVVNVESYPDFDGDLAAAMRLETIHYFGEVLRGGHSIFQFIDSDFTCVNDLMAVHYGMIGIDDAKFRKVPLEARFHRGGILTHAGILTGLSDGQDGHPIKRGVWLLKNLLDEPPPPPPPNVPELNREEPSLKNLTIAQALAVHRNRASCMDCHRKIDPWGIAFEEYDAVGNWQRDEWGSGLRAKRTQQPIESETELPNGKKVSGLAELKAELIRSKSDSLRRAIVRKLMAYALGRTLTSGDIDTADALLPALRAREDRLSALIELIVASKPFHAK